MDRPKVSRARLSVIKNRFDKAGIPWVIFAGAAAYCYGSIREITDIDILVKRRDLEKAKAVLREIDSEGFDIVAGSDFDLDDDMIKRTRYRELLSVMVPIIPVEDNIILKAMLQRGEEHGKHDIEDIKSMIKNEKIDLEYLKKRMRRWKIEKRVKLLLQTLIPNMSENKQHVMESKSV